jgi:hypothetical protein
MNFLLKEKRLLEKETCHPWCRIRRWDWQDSNSNFIPDHNNCCKHSNSNNKKYNHNKKLFFCNYNCGFSGTYDDVLNHEKICKKYKQPLKYEKKKQKNYKVSTSTENLDSKNPYEVLGFFGLNATYATFNDIKSSYKKLSIKYHPDKNPQNNITATENFKKISVAYDILKETYSN